MSSEPENNDSGWEGESGDDFQSDDSSHSQSCTNSTKASKFSKSTCVPKTLGINSLDPFKHSEIESPPLSVKKEQWTFFTTYGEKKI